MSDLRKGSKTLDNDKVGGGMKGSIGGEGEINVAKSFINR